jgi:hypothetical protein
MGRGGSGAESCVEAFGVDDGAAVGSLADGGVVVGVDGQGGVGLGG